MSVTQKDVKNEERAIVDESLSLGGQRRMKDFESASQKENEPQLTGSIKKQRTVLKIKRDDIEFHPAGPLQATSPKSLSMLGNQLDGRSNQNSVLKSWRINQLVPEDAQGPRNL